MHHESYISLLVFIFKFVLALPSLAYLLFKHDFQGQKYIVIPGVQILLVRLCAAHRKFLKASKIFLQNSEIFLRISELFFEISEFFSPNFRISFLKFPKKVEEKIMPKCRDFQNFRHNFEKQPFHQEVPKFLALRTRYIGLLW